MERIIERGTQVKILTGEHKGKIGTYQYHCCSGHKISIGKKTAYLRSRDAFSIVKKPKTEE